MISKEGTLRKGWLSFEKGERVKMVLDDSNQISFFFWTGCEWSYLSCVRKNEETLLEDLIQED